MARRVVSLVAGVVLVVAALGVAPTLTARAALIVGASSTNPTGAGVADFYGGRYRQDETVVANFFTGPFGVYHAIGGHRDERNVVVSSGWGAANVSLLLSTAKLTRDPLIAQPALYVLDNNVAGPNGGFGTRLPVFALIGVNPFPTPTGPGVPVVSVVYEYDINSNVPAFLWNVPAMANSLLAYVERRLNQDSLDFPIDADGSVADCDAGCREVLDAGGTVVRETADGTVRISRVGDTTYVGYESAHLPLVAPLRAVGANLLADTVTPALRAVVDFGYPDNDPLAAPHVYAPARLFPTRAETERFVDEFTDGVARGARILRDASRPESPSPTRAGPLRRPSPKFSPDRSPRRDRVVSASPRPRDRGMTKSLRSEGRGVAAERSGSEPQESHK